MVKNDELFGNLIAQQFLQRGLLRLYIHISPCWFLINNIITPTTLPQLYNLVDAARPFPFKALFHRKTTAFPEMDSPFRLHQSNLVFSTKVPMKQLHTIYQSKKKTALPHRLSRTFQSRPLPPPTKTTCTPFPTPHQTKHLSA